METLKNIRHEKFCQNYTGKFAGNLAQSYLNAGYDSKQSCTVACISAKKLLSNPKIYGRIKFLREKSEEKTGMKREDWLQRLEELSKGAEKETDQLKALELMGKAQGYFVPENNNQQAVIIFNGRDGTK